MAHYLNLNIERGNYPIIAFQEDENGNPILDDGEILVIKYGNNERGSRNREKIINLNFHGDCYQILRTVLLAGNYEDQLDENGKSRTKLSENNFYSLKKVVDNLLVKVEGRNLEQIAEDMRRASDRNSSIMKYPDHRDKSRYLGRK